MTLDTVKRTLTKNINSIILDDEQDNNNIYRGIATIEVEDSDGDIVRVDGIDISRHSIESPIKILSGHMVVGPQAQNTVIGRVIDIFKTTKNIDGINYKALEFTLELNDTQLALETKQLIDDGYLDSFSIGFRGQGHYIKDSNGVITGIDYTSTELLEISVVSVPSNRFARIIKSISDSNDILKSIDKVNVTLSQYCEINQDIINRLISSIEELKDNQKKHIESVDSKFNEIERRVDIIDVKTDDNDNPDNHQSKSQDNDKDDLISKLTKVLTNYKENK